MVTKKNKINIMKKTLLILACLLLAIVAWVFPYIDELRDQGLTVETAFGGSAGNYHGLDYALFYMDIRENAKLKVQTYLNNISQ